MPRGVAAENGLGASWGGPRGWECTDEQKGARMSQNCFGFGSKIGQRPSKSYSISGGRQKGG